MSSYGCDNALNSTWIMVALNRSLGRVEGHADGVDAVARVAWRVALAVEPVPQVGVASGATHLDPVHPVRVVLDVPDGVRPRLVEGRPAAVRVELRHAVEQ